ncbi:MAG: hypothetical protein M1829_005671 [Trizodia sp. TS-e1964]|nr:MAG: hypothetical protein M1829_005671 [Trizodia sp. TS-e1964]
MARRRAKKRTHVGAHNGPAKGSAANSSMSQSPKSMVIRIGAGEVGPSVSQLVKDERRKNKLKDFMTMAGPLGVSHLLLFSRSETGNTNLRLALTPRGPTMHFKVERYSLCKDIAKALKHPKSGGKEYLTAPLLVMNNFKSQSSSEPDEKSVPKHLESLTTSIFQSLFPPISPQSTPLKSIRRVLLLNREPNTEENGSYTIHLRHYAITTKAVGLSRAIRRLNAADKLKHSSDKSKGGSLPNLGKLEDVADYLLDPAAAMGYTSASETELDTDAEVEVLDVHARKILSAKKREQIRAKAEAEAGKTGLPRRTPGVEKRAIKLVELGPRMKLRLIKVEEGVCEGKVLWHEFLSKSKEEQQEMDKIWEARRKEKEERKRVQKQNVERKRKEKAPPRKKGEGDDEDEDGDEDEEMMDYDDSDLEAEDDEE